MAIDPGSEARRNPPLEPAAWLALALLTGTWAWWAIKEGAYFSTVFLPGAILLCVGAGILLRFASWRAQLRLSPPVLIAGFALAALGVWALLSATWSPAPDVAIGDGQRILVYALCFGLGVGLCNLLGPRMKLSLAPLAAAGGLAGLLTAVHLATGSNPRDLLEVDGTLDFPLGYRNANAAFFAIALFPALGLAGSHDLDWRLRGLALGAATLCVELFLLSQSRASVPAIAVALVVYLLLSPQRVRSLSWLALAAIPALAVLPALTSLYAAADGGIADVAGEMNRAGAIAAALALIAALLGAFAARAGARLPGLGSESTSSNRRVAIGLGVTTALAAIAFVAAVGDPVEWLSDRADEFRSAGTPDLSDRSTRFTFNAGSDRYDAWRVALDDAIEDPLFGDGGGGYQYSYLRKRTAENQSLHDAHSVELEILAELGFVGLALFLAAVVAVVVAVVRAMRLGPSAAVLGAVSLATASYWLVHASVDWFWPYPALTAPVLALVGSAAAPAVRAVGRRSTRPWRSWAMAALALLALSAIPAWLAQSYVNRAYEEWRTDLGRAYDDLEQAQRLDPLNDTPLLAEGSIAQAVGDRERALDAFREATEVRPQEWATHYLLAELQAETDPTVARNEIRVALELNPYEDRTRALARRLGVDPGAFEPKS